jgi:hypothetical protein
VSGIHELGGVKSHGDKIVSGDGDYEFNDKYRDIEVEMTIVSDEVLHNKSAEINAATFKR